MEDLNKIWNKIVNYDYKTLAENYLYYVNVAAVVASVVVRTVFGMPVVLLMASPAFFETMKKNVIEEVNKKGS